MRTVPIKAQRPCSIGAGQAPARCLGLLLVVAVSWPARADIVVADAFESGNPNQWGWTNGGGSFFVLQPSGGKPAAWLDSGPGYFSDHPNLSSIPPAGSELRRALDSASLLAVSFDFQRLDAQCFPQNTSDSTFALELIDLHSDPGGAVISAHVAGRRSPSRTSTWHAVSFSIPSDSPGAPADWLLVKPAGLDYGWQDLMHNVDGIRLFSINPDDVSVDACWRLGADNVQVSYGENIFADGFESAP